MTTLEDFVGYMEKGEEIGKLVAQREKDSRPEKKEEADKKLREYAYETLKDMGEPGIDFSTQTAETISGEYVNSGINLRAGMAREDSARTLSSKSDEIINALSVDSLEKIALVKPIVDKAGEGYGDMLNNYQKYIATRELVQKYNEGKIEDPRQLQILVAHGAEKARDEIKKKMKDKGYSKDLQEMAGNLASIAAKEGHIKDEYIKEGAKKFLADAEGKFRNYETEKGKKVADYVKGALGKLVKGDTREFETAKDLIYRTATGKLNVSNAGSEEE